MLIAAYYLYRRWRGSDGQLASLLCGLRSWQGALAVTYVCLACARTFCQNRAGSTGYPWLSAAVLSYALKMLLAALMELASAAWRRRRAGPPAALARKLGTAAPVWGASRRVGH